MHNFDLNGVNSLKTYILGDPEMLNISEYYITAIDIIDQRISFIKEMQKEGGNIKIPYFLGGIYYFDKNKKDRTNDLNSVLLIPFEYSSRIFINNIIATLSKTYKSFDSEEILNYLNNLRNELIEHIITNSDSKLFNDNRTGTKLEKKKRFGRGELKKLCAELAQKYRLQKGEELKKEMIDMIVGDLEKLGYKVIRKSVESVLRDKLGYKKINKSNIYPSF